MATSLKGRNFRILIYDSVADKFSCIGMATSCTVNLINNTENSETKDDTGLASKPTMVSQGWNVSVESLSVTDVGSLLTAIKSFTPFTLLWDETDTDNNQTALGETFARQGQAYLSDFTATFNNRENSVKNLQFQGTGELTYAGTTIETAVLSAGSYTKGQYVRLFLSSNNTLTPSLVIAAARQLSLHVSLSLQDATTKDTQGTWVVQEPTALSYDISTTALVRSAETITSQTGGQGMAEVEAIWQGGSPVKWEIANANGSNQRTKGAVIVSGSALITNMSINGPMGTADYTAQLQGYGDYTVAA